MYRDQQKYGPQVLWIKVIFFAFSCLQQVKGMQFYHYDSRNLGTILLPVPVIMQGWFINPGAPATGAVASPPPPTNVIWICDGGIVRMVRALYCNPVCRCPSSPKKGVDRSTRHKKQSRAPQPATQPKGSHSSKPFIRPTQPAIHSICITTSARIPVGNLQQQQPTDRPRVNATQQRAREEP